MNRLRLILPTLICFCSLSAMAEEPRSLAVSGGVFNFNEGTRALEAGVEHRFPFDKWGLSVATGLSVTDDGGYWFFSGLRKDFSLGGGWVFTPAFGAALYMLTIRADYDPRDSKDLGSAFHFRTQLEVGRRLKNRRRIALSIYHLSNAGLFHPNPGANSLIITYSFPLN